jgi:hypothetical protein
MAMRDQPYIQFYCQDYATDEKLAMCSYATQGIYIRILCAFHKSETYGGILFKEIPNQDLSATKSFAYALSRKTGVGLPDMEAAVEELLYYEVLAVDDMGGVPFLYQKRMVRDNDISQKRSDAGKLGGRPPTYEKQNNENIDILLMQNIKQNESKMESKTKANEKANEKQNSEYENENESVFENGFESQNNTERKVTGDSNRNGESNGDVTGNGGIGDNAVKSNNKTVTVGVTEGGGEQLALPIDAKTPKTCADFNATAQNGAEGGESTPKATNAHSVKNSAVSAASQKPTRHKYGEYGWVLLTDAEYGRAVAEYGEDTVTRYIAVVDEYVEGNGNKNGYKNWNTVLRKAIRQKWGNQNHAQTRGSRYGPQEVDKGRISNTLVEALKEVELETKKEAV